jgi:hypothetical protein
MDAKVTERLWARTSFERALHFRTTPFASIGDILEAVGEQDRGDFRYRHLAFAIGQISVVGTTERVSLVLMTFPFAPTNVGASRQVYSPWLGVARQSERQELELARSLCDSGSITSNVRLLSARVEKNDGQLSKSAPDRSSDVG